MQDNTRHDNPNDKDTLVVNAQYIKDFSFENPKTPSSLLDDSIPQMEIEIDVSATTLREDLFEVSLRTSIIRRAPVVKQSDDGESTRESEKTDDENVIFMLDLEYAGLFTINNVIEEKDKEIILLVHCPALLFPYSRQIISDVVHNGGYQPVMLPPCDFMGLYKNKQGELKRKF